MADRRVYGIGAISLILGTLLILTIAREVADEPVEILENSYPKIVPKGRATFTFSIVARQDFDEIQLRFLWAAPLILDVLGMIDDKKEYAPGDGPEEVLENAVRFSWFRNQSSALGIEPEIYERSLLVESREYRTLIYDYSDMIDAVSGRNTTIGIPLTFVGMINATGGNHYLEGYTDFIVNPLININFLSIAHNEEEMRYVPENQLSEGRLPISMGPRGFLTVPDVKKDDTIHVIFTAESVPAPAGRNLGMIQIIKVYLDGELYDEPIVNVIRQQLG